MKNRTLVVVLAVVLALVGTVGVFIYVRSADARALAGQQAVTVLVAKERIPAGTSATDAQKLVDTKQMPAGTVPEGALSEVDASLNDLVTSSDVAAGQLLTKPMFVAAASLSDGIAIPDGKIAVTIPTEAWQRAGGLVHKGSKVAVFDTFTILEGKGITPAGDGLSKQHEYNQATRLLLTAVEVLAVTVEDSGNGSTGNTENKVGKAIVTVAVSQADAEKLIHGQQTGTLYLALLGGKSDVNPSNGVDNRSIFGS
ncbi:hypothetical protein Lesp02_80150 [Lentzea sp. NBRC 105346]|uniref:Flp pilus assembly protein CpaB n=1 Tax=Lentzea sp. NBRC 105346 TaxID=3032205 RepID=UPI00249FBF5A|nr:Flp pilus assembly protein CpaB [Lentzea sp. NBRC 105346]GLZ35828.1 hypothetical protein Lesp02_80150 [Lentzea sp. NBRC 105346]